MWEYFHSINQIKSSIKCWNDWLFWVQLGPIAIHFYCVMINLDVWHFWALYFFRLNLDESAETLIQIKLDRAQRLWVCSKLILMVLFKWKIGYCVTSAVFGIRLAEVIWNGSYWICHRSTLKHLHLLNTLVVALTYMLGKAAHLFPLAHVALQMLHV